VKELHYTFVQINQPDNNFPPRVKAVWRMTKKVVIR